MRYWKPKWDISKWDISKWDIEKWDIGKWDISKWDISKWDIEKWDIGKWDIVTKWDILKVRYLVGTAGTRYWSEIFKVRYSWYKILKIFEVRYSK